MFAGHRLATALGVVGPSAVTGTDELSRKQLIRAGEAMVDAGLAIVLNEAGTKKPMCTLIARDAKAANQAARDAAAAKGDPRAHTKKHTCGLTHVITDRRDATRILGRIAKRERFNIGVHVRASRVLIVDLDTASQVKKFQLRCGEQRPGLTVLSPGTRDAEGNWAHKDGGHIWFDIPGDVELPTNIGTYKDPDAGWVAMWGEHQVLVPPSVRAEGSYVLVGSTHPLPTWLLDTVNAAAAQAKQCREESARRTARKKASGEVSGIDEWAARTPHADILIEDGWEEAKEPDSCGCPIWTAPGVHGSPKSATAHDPGCTKYDCSFGHGPLHVWTDNPSEAVAAAISAYGSSTLTKLQVITWTQGAGNMGRTCDELGIERPGPTIISRSLTTWAETGPAVDPVERTHPEPSAPTTTAVADNGDDDDFALIDDDDLNPTSIDEINEHSPRKVEELSYNEKMIRREYERIHWQKEALRRHDAENVVPLRKWNIDAYLDAPRPDPLVSKMLYRDSLARIFGAPGSGKSFLAMDLAMSIATGIFWDGIKLAQEKVVYVMAEGQRVNGDRSDAWMSRRHKHREDLRDWFYVVPDAVMLTEAGATEFVDWIRELKPSLVVLDTKNAMMVGEENSATDFAVMRRVLDRIRTASECCVVLVDHTGYEGTRARGSSAGTAAMDTEIKVTKDDSEKPSLITAEVTRDKAGEAGERWAWRLMPEHPAAVLERTDVPAAAVDLGEDWYTADIALPVSVTDYEGAGAAAVQDLAKFMAFQTGPGRDRAQLGVSLSEARTEMDERLGHKRMTTTRAWSALKALGLISPNYEEPTETQEKTGRHCWSAPIEVAR